MQTKSNISPIFPIPETDYYGFDPQVHWFQHKRETSGRLSIQFKIEKPISKDEPSRSTMHNSNKRKKRCWWKKALPFFKWRKLPISTTVVGSNEDRRGRACRNFRSSMSGPIYATESLTTPYRSTMTTNRPSSGPIAETLTPGRRGEVAIPYLSLRELNMEQPQRISISSSPIYLVT